MLFTRRRERQNPHPEIKAIEDHVEQQEQGQDHEPHRGHEPVEKVHVSGLGVEVEIGAPPDDARPKPEGKTQQHGIEQAEAQQAGQHLLSR